MMYTLNQKMHVSIDRKNNTGPEFYQGYFQTGRMTPEPFSFQLLAMPYKEKLCEFSRKTLWMTKKL